jgi:ABC-type glycerol-3-phosphate transport system substrate-binding protein
MNFHKIGLASAAVLSATILIACSGKDSAQKSSPQAEGVTVDTPVATVPAPRESLARDWSANGFEQLPDQYQWIGSGKRAAHSNSASN